MSKRKSNIYHRKDGRWEGRFHISGTKKYISVYGKSYSEAKEKLERIYSENFKSKVKCNSSFKETAEKWLEAAKCRIKESSFYCYANKLYKHIMPYFSSVKYCDVNKLNKKENDRLEQYLLSDTDSVKLGIYLRYKLKLTTGMLCALKWSDINLEKRKIYISKIVIRDSNIFSKNPNEPKTTLVIRDYVYNKGKKIFTIPQKITEILREFEPENKDVFLLTNSCNFIEPRCYVNFEKRCFDECQIKINNKCKES